MRFPVRQKGAICVLPRTWFIFGVRINEVGFVGYPHDTWLLRSLDKRVIGSGPRSSIGLWGFIFAGYGEALFKFWWGCHCKVSIRSRDILLKIVWFSCWSSKSYLWGCCKWSRFVGIRGWISLGLTFIDWVSIAAAKITFLDRGGFSHFAQFIIGRSRYTKFSPLMRFFVG